MPTEMEINSLINKHLVDKFTATDDLLGMLLKLQYDNNNLLSHIININLNHIYNENQDYTNLDIDNSKIFAGNYGVTLGNAESSDLVTCVINGRPIVCIAKSDVGQYERVIVVPGGSDTEPHIVALGILIKGNYEGTPKVVATDESGNLISEIVGSEGIPVLQNVIGALINEMQGSEGVAVKQEATGELVSVMQGDQGLDVKQDAITGALISEMQGSEGVAVKQEATGELVSVMQGDQGIITQDVNNNLISVMKGNYDGALKTWKVDVDGRGEMFINDTTDDWGKKNIIGLAELATRLSAKQGFDNRGRQIWSDGFESTALKWYSFAAALGAVARDTTYAWHDDASIKLTTGTADFSTAAIYKSFYNPLTGRYGIEITWSTNTTNINRFGVYLYFYDGSKEIITGLLFQSTGSGGFYYVDSTGGYTKLTTISNNLRADRHQWHKLKFVFDSDLEEYARILIDGHEIDMTGINTKSSASGATPYIKCAIELFGDVSNAYDSYVDNVIFTHREP